MASMRTSYVTQERSPREGMHAAQIISFFFEGEGDEPKGLLGKNLNIYIVLKGVQGISYINPARRIEQIARNPVAIEEWSRPVTVWTLNGPP